MRENRADLRAKQKKTRNKRTSLKEKRSRRRLRREHLCFLSSRPRTQNYSSSTMMLSTIHTLNTGIQRKSWLDKRRPTRRSRRLTQTYSSSNMMLKTIRILNTVIRLKSWLDKRRPTRRSLLTTRLTRRRQCILKRRRCLHPNSLRPVLRRCHIQHSYRYMTTTIIRQSIANTILPSSPASHHQRRPPQCLSTQKSTTESIINK